MRSSSLLLFVGAVVASPLGESVNAAAVAAVAQTAHQIDMAMLTANECKGQSCLVADVTGSTGS